MARRSRPKAAPTLHPAADSAQRTTKPSKSRPLIGGVSGVTLTATATPVQKSNLYRTLGARRGGAVRGPNLSTHLRAASAARWDRWTEAGPRQAPRITGGVSTNRAWMAPVGPTERARQPVAGRLATSAARGQVRPVVGVSLTNSFVGIRRTRRSPRASLHLGRQHPSATRHPVACRDRRTRR